MKFRVHFTLRNGSPDEVEIEGENYEEIRVKAEYNVHKRGGIEPWSKDLSPIIHINESVLEETINALEDAYLSIHSEYCSEQHHPACIRCTETMELLKKKCDEPKLPKWKYKL